MGTELYELARKSELAKLYLALDAMAFLACRRERYAAAARIAQCAEEAGASHGEVRRRPAEERMRNAVRAILDERLDPSWASSANADSIDELSACSLAPDM